MKAEARRRDFFQEQTKFDAVQQEAIDAAMAGKNIFLTGVAGTGKSLVTKVRWAATLQNRLERNESKRKKQ